MVNNKYGVKLGYTQEFISKKLKIKTNVQLRRQKVSLLEQNKRKNEGKELMRYFTLFDSPSFGNQCFTSDNQ